MHNHILLIGIHPALCDRINVYDINYTLIEKPERINTDILKEACRSFLFDYEDIDLLLNQATALYNIHPFDAVISLTETGLLPAAIVAESLQIPHTPVGTVRTMKDKSMMRLLSNKLTDAPVAYKQVNQSKDIHLFAKTNGFPFIIKPNEGMGSIGIRKITSYDDIPFQQEDEPLILESYLSGKELSVESFSFSGSHHIISITEKEIIGDDGEGKFVEIAHKMPASLSEKQEKKIKVFISDFLNTLGLSDGPAHTEIKLDGDTIHVIETHNRIGGDRISDLVRLSTGIDLLDLSLLWPLDKCQPEVLGDQPPRGAAIRFFKANKGVVKKIIGLKKAYCMPGVIKIEMNVKPGDTLKQITSSLDRPGFIIAVGETADEAAHNCKQAVDSVNIFTE